MKNDNDYRIPQGMNIRLNHHEYMKSILWIQSTAVRKRKQIINSREQKEITH